MQNKKNEHIYFLLQNLLPIIQVLAGVAAMYFSVHIIFLPIGILDWKSSIFLLGLGIYLFCNISIWDDNEDVSSNDDILDAN